ncbi:hypothetical protein [Prosthecobacter sp.]|uniref:hypothetical protein n=1 Tax=Prosthecobacter sp. TaxID=1965333 RepID=UPI003783E25E
MWEFIKHKLAKLGCFVLIALMMIAATAITKLVLGWFRHDDASNEALSNQVGEYVGKGLLGLAVLLGFIIMGRQLIAELRAKKNPPPTRPSVPPPLPQSNDKSRNA